MIWFVLIINVAIVRLRAGKTTNHESKWVKVAGEWLCKYCSVIHLYGYITYMMLHYKSSSSKEDLLPSLGQTLFEKKLVQRKNKKELISHDIFGHSLKKIEIVYLFLE